MAASCSGDFGGLGEVLGEDFGDLDVDFRSACFEVGGGVPGSDADFSVSFLEVEDSEFLCLRRLDWRRCFFWSWPSAASPLVWGASEVSVCSRVSSGAAACWPSVGSSVAEFGRNGLRYGRQNLRRGGRCV